MTAGPTWTAAPSGPGRQQVVPLDPPGRALLLAEPFPDAQPFPRAAPTGGDGHGHGDAGGELPVAVVSSGMGGAWHDWADVARALRGRVRVLVVDRPGCGDAPAWPAGTTDLDTATDDLVAALDAAGIDRAVLVGHSMGAWYVEACARRHPSRVTGLVLVDGSIARTTGHRAHPALVDARVRLLDVVVRHTLGWSVAGPAIRRVAEGPGPRRDRRVAHRAWCRHSYSRPGVWAAVLRESAAYPAFGDALVRLRSAVALPAVPVAVVSAALGPFPARWHPWVRAQRAQARHLGAAGPLHTAVIRQAPHMVMLTDPETLAGEILAVAGGAREEGVRAEGAVVDGAVTDRTGSPSSGGTTRH